MPRLPRRRLLGGLLITATGPTLFGCSRRSRADAEFSATVTDELREVAGVVDAEVTVKRDFATTTTISAQVTGAAALSRAQWEETALGVHRVFAGRELPPELSGAKVTVRLSQPIDDATVELGLAGISAAEVSTRCAAGLSEVDNGATTVRVGEFVASELPRVDDAALLAPIPDGANQVVRKVRQPDDGAELTVTQRPGQSWPRLPIADVAAALMPTVERVELGLRSDVAEWRVRPQSDDVSDTAFADALTVALRRLLRISITQQVRINRPWWVQLAVADTVTVALWHNESSRSEVEPNVNAVLAEVNH